MDGQSYDDSIVMQDKTNTPMPTTVFAAEDSGYHTSSTPVSFLTSEISNENVDPNTSNRCTLRGNRRLFTPGNNSNRKSLSRSSTILEHSFASPNSFDDNEADSNSLSPRSRRGKKRVLEELSDDADWSFRTASTPTSIVAKDLQNLDVNDAELRFQDAINTSETNEALQGHRQVSMPIPSTLVRPSYKMPKLSNISDVQNPAQSSTDAKKPYLRRTLHRRPSLTPVVQECTESKVISQFPKTTPKVIFPELKKDIIKELCVNGQHPAIEEILSYLGREDLHNFSLVSMAWRNAILTSKKTFNNIRKEHVKFINMTKENYENRDVIRRLEPVIEKKTEGSLQDIHNVVRTRRTHKSPVRSPPRTPKTTKLRKFAKSASMDERSQVICVRCRQPAKVTCDPSNEEEWAQCISQTCAYQFCKFCKCERHPLRTCRQYGLGEPSPSRRRQKSPIGSKNSRKLLKRCLF